MKNLIQLLAALALLQACTTAPSAPSPCTGQSTPTERLFLQQVTATSAIIRWRGEAASVCIGQSADSLTQRFDASTVNGHMTAQLTGLQADTRYFYAIGGAGTTDPSFTFTTAPEPGQVPADGNTHIWLLGDSGTQTEQFMGRFTHPGEAEIVKQGFLKYNADQADNEPVDLLLLLGDNAYLEGTDAQWQGAYFDIYPKIIRSVATWPTIGNHEMGAGPLDVCLFRPMPQCEEGPVMMAVGGISESADPASYDSNGDGPDEGGLPYLSIFDLPSRGEAGGVPSGTEQYYAFDYGNVHVVSLDSQLSNRDDAQRRAMRDWLVDDLSRNTLDWTIVIFHHPVYSKGENHDSDVEQAEIDMRETFAPVFEDYGVDLVFNGHAHSYERSWYLHGHHGKSDTFSAAQHAELNADGDPAIGQGEESYQQISSGSGKDDKAIYTVAGSAGKADEPHPCKEGQRLGCTLPDWLMHPAHRTFDPTVSGARPHGIARRGSVVVDATAKTLTSRFIDEHGEVLDWFVIER